ncbi:hypothetical protein NLI96_g8459 [Meripilus lineatus]|uniref:Uncharacterized protein n=1 Tax=Meripilus lineatus TaxID=2056292 RepID=A0AAD5UXJ7_9APHY|nr:hypothetical protein NLI96_g8459 [Physisporinus lineatus]
MPEEPSLTSSQIVKAILKHPVDTSHKDIRNIRTAARWIPCAVSPFIDLREVFKFGMYAEGKLVYTKEGDPYVDPNANIDADAREEHIQAYQKIFHKIPYLKSYVIRFENDPEGLGHLSTFIHNCAKAVRGEDINKLKDAVHAFASVRGISVDFGGHDGSKALRGFNHPYSGRLNCPMRDIKEFDRSWESYRDMFDEGLKTVDHDDWPCHAYKEDMYDPNNIEAGLMKGEFLFSVGRHIYTGKRTANLKTDGPSKGKGGRAKINHQADVTPEMIAYAAMLARFSLSSQSSWKTIEGSFDYSKYHRNVLELFEDLEDPWCVDLLRLYTKRFLSPKPKPERSLASRRNSDREQLKRQRASRRQSTATSS